MSRFVLSLSPSMILFFVTIFLGTFVSNTTTAQEITKLGQGAYFNGLPAGKVGPSGPGGLRVDPRILPNDTADSLPVPSNQYWSSLVFPRMQGNSLGSPVYLPPLSLKVLKEGIEIGCSSGRPSIDTEYHYHHSGLILVGIEGAEATGIAVSSYTETGAEVHLLDRAGKTILVFSFQKSSPVIAFREFGGKRLKITLKRKPEFIEKRENAFGCTIEGRPLGLFLTKGNLADSAGENGNVFQTTMEHDASLSVALLPDAEKTTFTQAAEIFSTIPAIAKVDYSFDPARSLVKFKAAFPERKKGLFTLLPHQWKQLDAKQLAKLEKNAGTYPSARGAAKVFFAESLEIEFPLRGLLPILPPLEGVDAAALKVAFIKEYPAVQLAKNDADTYWTGKSLLKLASLVPIADQLGLEVERDDLLSRMKTRLEDWFTAAPNNRNTYFAYDPKWGTLIGYNTGYGSEGELNDHHFHYGYFINAAATIARYDPEWAALDKWGGMVELLIRDAAAPDANDEMFPRSRCFDLWEGHSWAAGHGDFMAGNNNESSSEAMLFNAAVYFWGLATGNEKWRDHGAFLFAIEQAAIEQYWWDVDGDVFPDDYKYCAIGMVWGNGAAHATWFSAAPEMIHGINFLPISPASSYLGRRPDYVRKNCDEILTERSGNLRDWVDVIYSYKILGDPDTTRQEFDTWIGQGAKNAENGQSLIFTRYWIWSISAFGTVETSVTADISTYQVFSKDIPGKPGQKQKTYVAWNPEKHEKTIIFSDGTAMKLKPGEIAKVVK